MAAADFDPFDQQSTPAVSWTTVEDSDIDLPVGTTRYFEALGLADWVQQRNFDTGEPDFWPSKPGQEPQPKMAAVIKVYEHDGAAPDAPVVPHKNGTEDQAIWAGKAAKGATQALFNQLAAAQRAIGKRIDETDQIIIKLEGKKKDPANPARKAQKLWLAKVVPNHYPKRAAAPVQDESDPFASSTTGGGDEEPPF
jgi:hypothetical protein